MRVLSTAWFVIMTRGSTFREKEHHVEGGGNRDTPNASGNFTAGHFLGPDKCSVQALRHFNVSSGQRIKNADRHPKVMHKRSLADAQKAKTQAQTQA